MFLFFSVCVCACGGGGGGGSGGGWGRDVCYISFRLFGCILWELNFLKV